MAVGEKKNIGVISQVSWTDGTAKDVYYGQEHSFQYSSNVNCDDEMHGIKLSNKAVFTSNYAKCQLVSCGGNGVIALPIQASGNPRIFTPSNYASGGRTISIQTNPKVNNICPGVVFQDNFWYGTITGGISALAKVNNTGTGTGTYVVPYDHPEATDDSIKDRSTAITGGNMQGPITAILNYNNTRLVVATGAGGNQPAGIWVYYPELDQGPGTDPLAGKTGWKKVLEYEAGVTIVGLTCTFEYLKVWAVDEGWNTKVYYYQGNNNLRDTFVYNVVDLTGVRVCRVYSINGVDYYVSSQDGTDGYVNLYKMVGNTPVSLFHQRGGLDPLDINYKAPYFVGPCSIEAGYSDGNFYIADVYGLFQFRYTPNGYDRGYMKWGLGNNIQPYGVCFNQGYIYVSTANGCYKIRTYDTGVDGYQNEGVLISREYEGQYGGTVTKMLDEIRLNYELNPNTSNKGEIDVYVSPNNLWKDTHNFTESNGWYHVMHIDNTNGKTRTEKSNLLNKLGSSNSSSFKFDWQTLTYAIVLRQNTSTHATPIVRQIDIKYHTKDKTNNVYDIN